MGEYQPKFKPGAEVSYVASSDVKAGRLVHISGNGSVEHATAASNRVIGTAMFDAAAGELVAVQSDGVHRLIAAGTVNPGDRVAAAADGKVASATDVASRVGLATAGAADGAIALIKLNL